MASDFRIVPGGSRRLRSLLRYVGLSNHRVTDGPAAAAIENTERPNQPAVSADACGWLQPSAFTQHFRHRSELPPRIRAELAGIGPARPAMVLATDGDLSWHQRNARGAGVSAQYISSGGRGSLHGVSNRICVSHFKRKFHA